MYYLMKSIVSLTQGKIVRQKIKELDPEGVSRRQMHRLKRRQYVTKVRLVFPATLELILTL